jgi:Transmembrane protein 43
VEVLQWDEVTIEEGGSKRLTYIKKWSPEKIDSRLFSAANSHKNPREFPFASRVFGPKAVKLGPHFLPASAADAIHAFEVLPVTQDMLAQAPADVRAKAKLLDRMLYLGDSTESPEVGDVRISFLVIRSGVRASAVGRLVTNNLTELGKNLDGDPVLPVAKGELDAQALLHADYTEPRLWAARWASPSSSRRSNRYRACWAANCRCLARPQLGFCLPWRRSGSQRLRLGRSTNPSLAAASLLRSCLDLGPFTCCSAARKQGPETRWIPAQKLNLLQLCGCLASCRTQ